MSTEFDVRSGSTDEVSSIRFHDPDLEGEYVNIADNIFIDGDAVFISDSKRYLFMVTQNLALGHV